MNDECINDSDSEEETFFEEIQEYEENEENNKKLVTYLTLWIKRFLDSSHEEKIKIIKLMYETMIRNLWFLQNNPKIKDVVQRKIRDFYAKYPVIMEKYYNIIVDEDTKALDKEYLTTPIYKEKIKIIEKWWIKVR